MRQFAKMMKIGKAALMTNAFVAVVVCKPKQVSALKAAPLRKPRRKKQGSLVLISGHSFFKCGQAKGRIRTEANNQRVKLNVIGGIISATPRPMTKFPAQKSTARNIKRYALLNKRANCCIGHSLCELAGFWSGCRCFLTVLLRYSAGFVHIFGC